MSLTIALNRGRILKECLPLLARCGIDVGEDISASRKLVFDSVCGNFQLLIVRGSDVPTYVEHGAADLGVTGKDTLLEHDGGSGYYERLDMGIGRCQLMTAAPVGADLDLPKLRVATKFVRVAQDHYARLRQPVSIIALSGAMEIAPVMGLADCIVDIVDTGNTLRANGLEALDSITEVSTRLIVNKAAMKTKFDAVEALITQLRAVV